MPLTEAEERELLALLEQEDRELVAPKFEDWRMSARMKVACGGRGAGAKSRSVSSLLVQMLEERPLRWFCGRQIQKSLEESSFSLILDQIERLGYTGWEGIPSSSKIVNRKNGSYFYFAGIRDEKAAKNIKGLEDYDGAWIDEAEDILMDVWDVLIPSFRKEGSEIWITFNRNKEKDAAWDIGFINPEPGTMAVFLEPGMIDNPWFPEVLKKRMEHDYATRPDIAEWVWGGKPKKQGFNSVMSRVEIRAAMNRKIEPVGQRICGVDVARFGDDDTEMYLRKGMSITDHKSFNGLDTVEVADRVWDFVGRDPSVEIIIDDTGLGGGVTDRLRHEYKAKVTPINFGASPGDKDKYIDFSSELWFEFPIDEVDLPDDDDLMDELSERQYDYDKRGVKKVEPKKIFKERFGRSPDKGDACLLCFYTGLGGRSMSEEAKEALRRRRRR